MHLSRHRKVIFIVGLTLRPGDDKRYARLNNSQATR